MIRTLVNDTFSFNIVVAVGGTLKAARVAYGKEIGYVFPEDVLNEEGGLGNFTVIEGRTVGMVWLRFKPKDPWSISSLAHEAYHVAAYIMQIKGIKDEECGAYIAQWVVRKVLTGR